MNEQYKDTKDLMQGIGGFVAQCVSPKLPEKWDTKENRALLRKAIKVWGDRWNWAANPNKPAKQVYVYRVFNLEGEPEEMAGINFGSDVLVMSKKGKQYIIRRKHRLSLEEGTMIPFVNTICMGQYPLKLVKDFLILGS